MIRLLTFTNLYPSEARARHGIFVEQRLRRLVETGRVRACVVVPVPSQPLRRSAPSAHAVERHGIPVRYCPFPAVRGVTTIFHPRLMAHCAFEAANALRAEHGGFDLVDAQFLYPDGVAGVHLARRLRLPVTITARGSDVNAALSERVAGRSIRWAARRAAAIIAVSAALREAMIAGGLPADRIAVLRNGVDLQTFRPAADRDAERARLGLHGTTLLAVGNLVPEKDHALLLAALQRLPTAHLVVLGSGPLSGALRAQAETLGVSARVSWREPVPQAALQAYYAAADLTVLTSTREGMPNVLLESLACGTPVVSMAVGGAAEVVVDPAAGRLVRERSPQAVAAACRDVLAAPASRADVRRIGERFGWAEPVAAQLALLERIVGHA